MMLLEYDALQPNNTWMLQECPRGARIITGKWVFHHKWNLDGSLDRYKSRWLVCGLNQHPGIDFKKHFAGRQTSYHQEGAQPGGIQAVGGASTRHLQCVLAQELVGNGVLQPADWLCTS